MTIQTVRSVSLGNCMRARLLMIAALCSVLSTLVLFLCLIAPFWFDVTSHVHYPNNIPEQEYTEHLGITGYVDYMGRWHNLNMIEKATRIETVPRLFKMAQFFYISAFMVALVGSVATVMLAVKPYRHFVAEVGTTVALFYAALGTVLAIVLAMACLAEPTEHHIWPERSYQIEKPQWAAYISMIGAFVQLVAFFAMAIETMKSCRTIERVRSKPKIHLEDEPRYYKFDYRRIPKVQVEPNPILVHAYTNPALGVSASTPLAYHPSTPSQYSQYSYSTQPSGGEGYPPRGGPGYAPYAQPARGAYLQPQAPAYAPNVSYGDSDMSSVGVSVDDQGRRMVSM